MTSMVHFVAQTGGAAASAFALNNIVTLTILFIFLGAIVGVVARLVRKDKCLKLLHNHHVTYCDTSGASMWGDVLVFSHGLEILFDAPYVNRRGLTKSSAMIYDHELAGCLAVLRTEDALTEQEKRERARQIERSFNPGFTRRTLRRLRNIFNILRDAFSKALTTLIGQIAKTSRVASAQKGQIEQMGQSILGVVNNAYEPMLERHIGKPIILELAGAGEKKGAIAELPGYLVEYTDRFLAVFNVEHQEVEALTITATKTLESEGCVIRVEDDEVEITCAGPDVIIVKHVKSGSVDVDLGAALPMGASLRVRRTPREPVEISIERTRRVDIVCPRSVGTVRYDGAERAVTRAGWKGAVPNFIAKRHEGEQGIIT